MEKLVYFSLDSFVWLSCFDYRYMHFDPVAQFRLRAHVWRYTGASWRRKHWPGSGRGRCRRRSQRRWATTWRARLPPASRASASPGGSWPHQQRPALTSAGDGGWRRQWLLITVSIYSDAGGLEYTIQSFSSSACANLCTRKKHAAKTIQFCFKLFIIYSSH